MGVAIIATIYAYEPVIASVMKFGATDLYLLTDKVSNEEQNNAVKKVKETLGKYVNIKVVKTDVYDIVNISQECVSLIDSLKKKNKILVNVSAARKTKAFGLLFACYARPKDVDKIFYITKEDKEAVLLPKISFNLNPSQRKVLMFFSKNEVSSITDTYHSLNISKSMFYKTYNELNDMGFLSGLEITDAGRIALL